MSAKLGWVVLCLIGGIGLGAYGLAERVWPLALIGIAMVLVFWYLAFQWLTGANRPMGAATQIKPSAHPAWNMKDEPAPAEGKKDL